MSLIESIESIDLGLLFVIAVVSNIASASRCDGEYRPLVAWLTAFTFAIYSFYQLSTGYADVVRLLLVSGSAHGLFLFLVPTIGWIRYQAQDQNTTQAEMYRQLAEEAKQNELAVQALLMAEALGDVSDEAIFRAVETVRSEVSPEQRIGQLFGLHADVFQDQTLAYQLLRLVEEAQLEEFFQFEDSPTEQDKRDAKISEILEEYEFDISLPETLGLNPETHEAKQLILAAELKLMRKLKRSFFNDEE